MFDIYLIFSIEIMVDMVPVFLMIWPFFFFYTVFVAKVFIKLLLFVSNPDRINKTGELFPQQTFWYMTQQEKHK